MNEGTIHIHGFCHNVAGYAMQGDKICIEKNTDYRTGIHIKEYKEKLPVFLISGEADNFLSEYLAGGIIIVLESILIDFL